MRAHLRDSQVAKFLAPTNATNVNAAAVLQQVQQVQQMLKNAGLQA